MKFLNNVRIRSKLVISCIIISILPIILITVLMSARLYETSMNKIMESANASLAQWKANYMNLLKSQNSIVDSLVSYSPLRTYADTHYDDPYSSLSDYINYVYPVLNLHNGSKTPQNNATIKIYTNNGTIGYSSEINNSLEDLKQLSWYHGESNNSKYGWSETSKIVGAEKTNYICCYTNIRDPSDFTQIKMVIATFLPESSFYSLINEEKDKTVFLCNDAGDIISSTDRACLDNNMNQMNFRSKKSFLDLFQQKTVSYQDKSYIYLSTDISVEEIGIQDWKLIYMIPQEEIMGEFNKTIISSLFFCFLCLILSLIMIIIVSKSITDRLSLLAKNIHRVAQRNFKPIVLGESGDEIGQIEMDFNSMASNIDSLITTVYEADLKIRDHCIAAQKIEMKKKEAEMIALKAQINPHFLFNTLETIRMNLLIKDDRETATVMQVFAEGIREYMNSLQEFATIEEEISFVKKYIFIQEYRFKDKIQLRIHLDDALKSVLIPRLLIQPLVENAVFHGIEPKNGKGTIILDFSKSQNKLFINVSDDGVGMEESKLKSLVDSLNMENENDATQNYTNLALRNIHTRIRLMYGDAYGLTIHSKNNYGTEIEAVIPIFDASKS